MGHGHRNSTSFVSSFKSSAKRIAVAGNTIISPNQQTTGSIFDDAAEQDDYPPSFSTKRSSTSTSSRSSRPRPYTSRAVSASASTASLQNPPERKPLPSRPTHPDPSASSSISSQRGPSAQQNLDGITHVSHADSNDPSSLLTMAATASAFANGFRPEVTKPPGTSQSSVGFGQGGNNASGPTPSLPPAASTGGMQNPSIVYQQIHDISSKRISTLGYLRKAHEGRVYWFNTLLFNKADLSKMPFFEPRRLARRATNYLLLGLSLPSILDLNTASPQEYLRALNALLSEFDSYQQIHPPDGGSASSLSRARLPSMFKRAAHASTKGRRTSSATDIGLPMNTSDPADLKAMSNVATTGPTSSSFPASEQDLLPGEEYTHLLTPSLPFDPDFFETFATLCDVLIDCYTKVMSLIPSPAMCVPGTGEIFAKADTKLRKVILQGIIKEFEDASRAGAKTEFAGLGKVVLGGLM